MGNIESAEGENLEKLKNMKLILDKGHYKVFENTQGQKYDFWSLKSSDYSFSEEIKIGEEIKKQNLDGLAKIEEIQKTRIEKLFNSYYILSILTEHPLYTLREYLQKKAINQCLVFQQIQDLLISVVNAQYYLGSKKQYLGFENIYTSDGKYWKIKPFFETKSFYQELLEYKSKNLPNIELSGFPSPEEYKQSNCDTDRVQIFGLGMLMLELITGRKSKEIYQKYKIDENLFQQNLELLRTYEKKFSGNFIEITIDMLDLDIVRRPNYQQLYTKLNSKESNINSQVKNLDIRPIDFNNNNDPNSVPDIKIISAISNIQQIGNSKIDDQQIKFSKANQPQQNLVVKQQQIQYQNYQNNESFQGISKLDTKKSQFESQGFGDTQTQNLISGIKEENIQKLYYDDQQNRIKYIGEIHEGMKHGNGKLYYQSGKLQYDGNFNNDKYDGNGILFNESPVYEYQIPYVMLKEVQEKGYWNKYKGQFKNGLKCGQGIWYFSDNSEFMGYFLNDLPNGEGVIKRANNEDFHGEWEVGVLSKRISGNL